MRIVLKRPLREIFVTQPFGPSSDPELQAWYERNGLLGHNGLDFRASEGTLVLAAHDGWCEPKWSEGLGDHIKLHGDGYGTAYAHLSLILVDTGQRVVVGQPIGLSGSTGHVTGPHLHFELWINGEGEAGYGYRIDPMPYLEGAEMFKVGWHADNQAAPSAAAWGAFELVPPEVLVVIPPMFGVEDMRRVRACCPSVQVFLRPYFDPGSLGDKERPNYDAAIPTYADQCLAALDRYGPEVPEGQLHLHPFCEQNMPRWSQWEGFGERESDMRAFNRWFCWLYERVKPRYPGVPIGFPPLTIGNMDAYFQGDAVGVHYYMHGPEAAKPNPTDEEVYRAIQSCICKPALTLADEHYCHTYVHEHDSDPESAAYGLRPVTYAKFFPKALDVWTLEAGYPNAGTFAGSPRLLRWFDAVKRADAQGKYRMRGVALWKLGKGQSWGAIWEDGDQPRREVQDVRSWLNEQPPAEGFTDLERRWSTVEANAWPATMKHVVDHGAEGQRAWVNERKADNGVDVIFVSYSEGRFRRTKLDGRTWLQKAEEEIT